MRRAVAEVSLKRLLAAATICTVSALALDLACAGGAACGPSLGYFSPLPASATSCVLIVTAGDASITVDIGDMPADAGCSAAVACSCAELGGLTCWRSCQGQLLVSGDFDAAVGASGIFHDASAKAALTCGDAAVVDASTLVTQWMCAL